MTLLENSVPKCQERCQETDGCIGFRIRVAEKGHSCHLKSGNYKKEHSNFGLSGPRKCDPGTCLFEIPYSRIQLGNCTILFDLDCGTYLAQMA